MKDRNSLSKIDESADTYTCHYGRKLVNVGTRKSKTFKKQREEKLKNGLDGALDMPVLLCYIVAKG